jgi:hypothetical protein
MIKICTAWSIEIVPRGGHPLKMGGPPLEFINIQPQIGGLPRVRLYNKSTYSPPKGGPPLESINIQPPTKGVRLYNSSTYSLPKGGSPLEFINQRGSASRFHQLTCESAKIKVTWPCHCGFIINCFVNTYFILQISHAQTFKMRYTRFQYINSIQRYF